MKGLQCITLKVSLVSVGPVGLSCKAIRV